MNINQAKAVAGIRNRIRSRADLQRAALHCKNEIITARRANDDIRAAELSEAKAFFQKRVRAQNTCPDCGVTIARGATHCRIHARPQSRLIQSPTMASGERKSQNNNARVHWEPKGGPLAEIGFYCAPVQKIVRKWEKTIGVEVLGDYFMQVACPVIASYRGNSELKLPMQFQNHNHWKAIFELGQAITKIMDEKSKPERWLLFLPEVTVGSSDGFRSWLQISEQIVRWGGPRFTPNRLAGKSANIRITSVKPPEVWRAIIARAVVTK